MTFFTAEDFQVGGINADNYDDMAAILANQKLQRDAKVVYGLKSTKLGDEFYFSEHKDDADTHRGLLICVEEIEKKPCEHEPELTLGKHGIKVTWPEPGHENISREIHVKIKCSKCGVKLKAKWEVVDEQR